MQMYRTLILNIALVMSFKMPCGYADFLGGVFDGLKDRSYKCFDHFLCKCDASKTAANTIFESFPQKAIDHFIEFGNAQCDFQRKIHLGPTFIEVRDAICNESEEKKKRCFSLGADETIRYTKRTASDDKRLDDLIKIERARILVSSCAMSCKLRANSCRI